METGDKRQETGDKEKDKGQSKVKSKKFTCRRQGKSNHEGIYNRSPAMPRGVIDSQCWP